MFCPNCNKKLKSINQEVCHNCGSKIPNILESLQSLSTLEPTSQNTYIQYIKRQVFRKKDFYTKRALEFGIISLIFVIMIPNIGFRIASRFDYSGVILISFIAFGILHFIGLILGILSKMNNLKARNFETENKFTKPGSILGLVGIIGNSLFMALCFLSAIANYSIS